MITQINIIEDNAFVDGFRDYVHVDKRSFNAKWIIKFYFRNSEY